MRKPTLVLVLVACALAADRAGAQTAEQRSALARGEQVFVTEQVAGAPWPRATAMQLVDATPEEATAVFFDYELQRAYIPDLRRARISRRVDARTTEVDYTLAVPVVSDEDFTMRDRVSAGAGGGYRIDWTLVRASSTKATEGFVRFEPVDWGGRRRTLMVYQNFVTPGSRLAGLGLIERRALAQMREAAGAIVRQVERERAEDAPRLARQVAALRSALAER